MDLMKERYKVIAPYPGMKFKVGDIFTYDREIAQTYDQWIDQNGQEHITSSFPAFPHLFKRLEWWEDRKPEDMPGYLKWNDTGVVVRVNRYREDNTFFYLADDDAFGYSIIHTSIATEAEYLAYKDQQKGGSPHA